MFKAAIVLSQQYNITIDGNRIGWQTVHTGGNAIDAVSGICELLSASNIVSIVGPALSGEVPIVADFAEKLGIPVISYGATDPELSDRNAYPTFYRTVASDDVAALAIVKLFSRFDWTSCIIIYQNNAFGSSGAKIINEVFAQSNLTVLQTIVFDIKTLRIRGDLKTSLTSSSTRIIVLWATPSHTSLILQEALHSGVLGPHFTWILSSSVSLNSFNKTFQPQLIGMLTVEPTTAMAVNAPTNTTLLNAAYEIWKQYEPDTFPGADHVIDYALFAFDATWFLIQALQRFCLSTTTDASSCLSFDGSPFCFDRRLTQSRPLLETLNTITLTGVSGAIQFIANRTDRNNGSYYLAQNAQASTTGMDFVPVLNYSDADGWRKYTATSVIIWPGTSLTLPTGKTKLDGVNLRIGIVGLVPFTIQNTITDTSGQNVTTYTGYVPDLIALLQAKLNFVPNIQMSPANLSRNELIKAMSDGAYDMLVGDITVTAARRQIVGFSSSIFDTSTRLLMRETSDVQVELLSFLKPFTRNLWLLILSAIVSAALLLCLFEREANEALRNRSIVSLCIMGLWYCFGTVIGTGADYHVSTAAGRLLTAGLYILSIILLASYTANLASDLTLLKSKGVISSIADIKAGKLPFSRIGVITESSLEDYYLREISHGERNHYPLQSVDDLFDKLLNAVVDACFLDTGYAEYLINNVHCNLTLVGETFDGGAFGIVMSKQWVYQQDLDVAILSLRESGDLDSLIEKWFQAKKCPASSQTSTAMGVDSMGGLFLVFAVVVALSVLLFLWTKRCLIREQLLKVRISSASASR